MRNQLKQGLMAALFLTACSGETIKDVTATSISKAVEAGKGVVAGVDEGIDDGRKVGLSADGARIVSSYAELGETASIKVGQARAIDENQIEVQLQVDNRGDAPLRLTEIKVLGLDADGFAHPGESAIELTVPPQAKGELLVTYRGKATKSQRVRVWGTEVEGKIELE